MNFLNFQHWAIRTRLLVILLVAVSIPFISFLFISLTGASQINVENVKAFVSQTNQLAGANIADDVREVAHTVEDFITDAEMNSTILEPLIIRNTRGTSRDLREIEANLDQVFETGLITELDPHIKNAWLITPRGILVASASQEGESLPFDASTLNARDTVATDLASDLAQQSDRDSALIVLKRDAVTSFELVHVLHDENGTAQGFLITQLNNTSVFLSHLQPSSGRLPTYSFVVVPPVNDLLALPDVIESEQVNIYYDSLGLQRAITEDIGVVDVYQTGPEESRREVIGHTLPLSIEGVRLAVVTEINSSVISQQVLQYGSTVIFVLAAGTVLLSVTLAVITGSSITNPLQQIREAIRGVTRGTYDMPLPDPGRGDEIGEVSGAVYDMRNQVQAMLDDLRQRLDTRTRDVQLTQRISQTTIAERDVNLLMSSVVNLIVDSFEDIYHAQIFLIDNRGEYAVLRASTGQIGKQLIERGHRLEVGSVSVIGQTTEQGEPIIARDTAASGVHRRNEFLVDTRAELAIPLRLGDQIIGALDVQSRERDVFDDEMMQTMQTLADQISIAIANAQLYENSQRLLRDLHERQQEQTRKAWANYLAASRTENVVHQAGVPTSHDFTAIRHAVMKSGKPVVGDRTTRNTIPFGIPIKLRGDVLGVVEYEVPRAEFKYDKVLLAEELVDRLAISLDNARLFHESQQAAERERLVNDISTRITGHTDIQAIIETAIHEVSQALRTPQVAIRLEGMNHTNGHSPNGNHTADVTDHDGQPEVEPESDV